MLDSEVFGDVVAEEWVVYVCDGDLKRRPFPGHFNVNGEMIWARNDINWFGISM